MNFMKQISIYDFVLIKGQQDYIQFKIRYSMGEFHWDVSGMGWLHENAARYYLSEVFKNGRKRANRKDLEHAEIFIEGYSLRFQHAELDCMTKMNIENHFKRYAKQKTSSCIE